VRGAGVVDDDVELAAAFEREPHERGDVTIARDIALARERASAAAAISRATRSALPVLMSLTTTTAPSPA
jgi:hypothetical protein